MNKLSFTLILLIVQYSSVSISKEKLLPKTVTHTSGLKFNLCAEQKITKAIFFDIVQVGVYYPNCPKEIDLFQQDDKLLRFHYLREVEGRQFKEGAEEYLKLNLTQTQQEQCYKQYQELNASYVDVNEGDYYDLFHMQPIGLDLYLNGKNLNQLKNSSCELLYFNIWFGKESMSSDFQDLLSH